MRSGKLQAAGNRNTTSLETSPTTPAHEGHVVPSLVRRKMSPMDGSGPLRTAGIESQLLFVHHQHLRATITFARHHVTLAHARDGIRKPWGKPMTRPFGGALQVGACSANHDSTSNSSLDCRTLAEARGSRKDRLKGCTVARNGRCAEVLLLRSRHVEQSGKEKAAVKKNGRHAIQFSEDHQNISSVHQVDTKPEHLRTDSECGLHEQRCD